MTGAVDAFVHARKKTSLDVTGQLATALDLAETLPVSLVDAINRRGRTRRIVVDAVDEATDAESLIEELLQPLSRSPCGQLLVGVLEPWVRRLDTGACVVINLDRDTYFDQRDLVDYVERRNSLNDRILISTRGLPA